MRYIAVIVLLTLHMSLSAQIEMPAYRLKQDSSTHITVTHIKNTELLRIKRANDTTPIQKIQPDIVLKSGVVEHRGLTGDLYVRLYYVDSLLIGYLEYDGRNMKRELYYKPSGDIFLEKRYVNGKLIYTNNKIQTVKRKKDEPNKR